MICFIVCFYHDLNIVEGLDFKSTDCFTMFFDWDGCRTNMFSINSFNIPTQEKAGLTMQSQTLLHISYILYPALIC